jgi:hypothetical protein
MVCTANSPSSQLLTIFVAIGVPDTNVKIAPVLQKLGGGFKASVQEPPENIPSTVTTKQGRSFV